MSEHHDATAGVATADVAMTGGAVLDLATHLATLEQLHARPLDDHADVYEALHADLHRVLASIETT